MPSSLNLLFEAASGYALFGVREAEDVAAGTSAVTRALSDFPRFAGMVKLRAFEPFASAEAALKEAEAVGEGTATPALVQFVREHLGSKATELGVADARLGAALQEALGKKRCRVVANERVQELLRGVRLHLEKVLSAELKPGDWARAQLGLAHAYSRARIQYNPHKADNSIIQSIALLDQLDKDVNAFGMRVREWYSWHFPELAKLVNDNVLYAKLVRCVGDRAKIDEAVARRVVEIVAGDERLAHDIVAAARTSMGTEISPVDLLHIDLLAVRLLRLTTYREQLHAYLVQKMGTVAPSLRVLLGEHVAARLIAHAGSLTNLAKYPASTVQILGAEKALFRALKQARGNRQARTPKYGLLFNSTFISKAKQRAKGRISRYLANKVSIASRIDCFGGDAVSEVYGRRLREQVEERLRFYETGAAPRKNVEVMAEAVAEAAAEGQARMVEAGEEEEKRYKHRSSREKHQHREHSEERRKKKKKRHHEEAEKVEETEERRRHKRRHRSHNPEVEPLEE
ncbi:hypothetical protein CDCA_CDCA08G2347 [Cyanidium caldarium]|uniref:Nucleolar protein 56 n=1 Tax=Cyanidium caldarium TaxID=2771 RepID=A0AAV9IVG0_CYACA|nr:hypothetical protein CDCA_CDCA08G2347 [Cyanidium caldarium]